MSLIKLVTSASPAEIVDTLNRVINDVNFFTGVAVGTWTPAFFGSSVAGTPTHSTQSGSYELIGRQLTARFFVAATSLTGMTGNLNIGGLPVASFADPFDVGVCFLNMFQGWTGGAGYTYISGSIGSVKNIVIGKDGSAVSSVAVPITDLAASVPAPLIISGMCNYRVV